MFVDESFMLNADSDAVFCLTQKKTRLELVSCCSVRLNLQHSIGHLVVQDKLEI